MKDTIIAVIAMIIFVVVAITIIAIALNTGNKGIEKYKANQEAKVTECKTKTTDVEWCLREFLINK